MNQIANVNEQETMSHVEIAEVVKSRPDKVKQSMRRLESKGIIQLTPVGEVNHKGQHVEMLHVNERDSYIVAAQLSPEYTADLVDKWQDLESGNAIGKNSLPENYICGDSGLIAEYGATAIAGLPDTDERNKVCHLSNDFVVKKFTISNTGSTYMKVPAWIMGLAKCGYKKILLVTNESNPHIEATAEHVMDMKKLAGDNLKICLMTDKSASRRIALSKRALLCAPK